MRIRIIILSIAILACINVSHAQIMAYTGKPLDVDSVKNDFENQPYFGLYKDNYFIFGPSLKNPNNTNTNIKFHAALGGLVGLLAIGLVEYTWFYPRNMFLFWILFAVIASAVKLIETEAGRAA